MSKTDSSYTTLAATFIIKQVLNLLIATRHVGIITQYDFGIIRKLDIVIKRFIALKQIPIATNIIN